MELIIKKTTITPDYQTFCSYLNSSGSFGRKKDAVILDEKKANSRLNLANKEFKYDIYTTFEIIEA